MNKHYFDYAAATPMSDDVKNAISGYLSDDFYNPSASYINAQNVKSDVEKARQTVAGIIGAKPSEIIFTAGGTEANNLAIQGLMSQYTNANCIVSAVEHPSVLEVAKLYKNKIAPVKNDGRIDLEQLKKLIDDQTVLISLMYVNNEIGTIQPLAKISQMVKEIRSERTKKGNDLPLYLHTDACQAPNYLNVLVNTLGVDLMTLNGGKIYGPKQSAILFVKTGVKLRPLIYGGGQERAMRSGTENVSGVVGFAEALKETSEKRESEQTRLEDIKNEALAYIKKEMPTVQLNGSKDYRIANNLHLSFDGQDNETLMMALDEKGFMVAVGSACKASSDDPSHVLKAIGLSDEQAQSSIRITLGRDSTKESVLELLKMCKKLSK